VPDRREVGGDGQTALLVAALCGAATPIVVAVFARDRLWHEGLLGFIVAITCALLVARSAEDTWQRRTARVLVSFGGVAVIVVIGLVVLLLVAIGHNGLPP
jgi:putative flippase GtrA